MADTMSHPQPGMTRCEQHNVARSDEIRKLRPVEKTLKSLVTKHESLDKMFDPPQATARLSARGTKLIFDNPVDEFDRCL